MALGAGSGRNATIGSAYGRTVVLSWTVHTVCIDRRPRVVIDFSSDAGICRVFRIARIDRTMYPGVQGIKLASTVAIKGDAYPAAVLSSQAVCPVEALNLPADVVVIMGL